MRKIASILSLWFVATGVSAVTTQQFHNANAEQALKGFRINSAQSIATRGFSTDNSTENELQLKHERRFSEATQQFITSYYQYYHGVRVLDGEVSIHEKQSSNKTRAEGSEQKVVGQLLQNIEVSPLELERLKSLENLDQALATAKAEFHSKRRDSVWKISQDKANLVLKNQNGKLIPVYEVSFYAKSAHRAPVIYHAFLDPAQHNKVLKSWNDMMKYSDKAPGGNKKTSEYHYGDTGIPFLDVLKQGGNGQCVLNDKKSKLIVVDMSTKNPDLDTYYDFMNPYMYECNSENRDITQFNGAFSPADDAYYFGHVVQNVYQEWFNTKVLDLPKIALRVHFRENNEELYDNAFWDPSSSTMNFGDGTADPNQGFYPWVSLDVTAHEMSHGFTSAHSDLQYYDQSGALNESFSDMAGIVAVAYLREKAPQFYQAIYHKQGMAWTIGSTVMKNPSPSAALRYMDRPSRDEYSADCYHDVSGCYISYDYLAEWARTNIPEEHLQSFIVHTGSGVFNRFFYFLANTPGWDIKKAFNLMMISNRDGYWTQTSNFDTAACQTLQAAKDLKLDTTAVKNAFDKVGVPTSTCF